MADGGTLTRNAVEDGDDAERARLERKSAGRIHSAFIAVLNEVLPAGTTEANITPELATLRLVGAWGKVRDELVRMLTDAALMGARFAFYYNTGELQANEPTLTSSWDTVNEEVLRYVLGDAFQMGGGIADELTQQLLATSERQIKMAIAEWVRNGQPLAALVNVLETTALSRNRAELIATTEVTRAYAEVARLTWAQGGVIQSMRWQTANDDDVCPICRPLNQQVVAVVGGSFAAVDEDGNEIGRVPRPPAHPRCRCWLSPVAPAVAPVAPKKRTPKPKPALAPKPAPDAWPKGIDGLVEIRPLGGSTGATLVEDPVTGARFVLKRGASAKHLESEVLADTLYRAMGANVPDVRLYKTATGPVKLARFIDGKTLAELRRTDPAAYQAALQTVRKDFAKDALLGNWDVIGQEFDNILVDAGGKVWRIDNGGALLYRAQGQLKAKLPTYVDEFWSMRNPAVNQQTAEVFADLDYASIVKEMRAILDNRPALEAALNSGKAGKKLIANVAARLDSYRDYVGIHDLLTKDAWKGDYVESFTRHIAGLRNSGIVDKLPKRLLNSDVYVKDEAGRAWDHLRARGKGRSIVHGVADYIQGQGGDYSFVSYWEGAQAGSSWSPASKAIKVFYTKQRNLNLDDAFWWQGNRADAEDIYARTIANLGEAKYQETFTAWHAFNYEFMRTVDFAGNDIGQGLVRLIRTESVEVMQINNLIRGQSGIMRRGAVESTSIFRKVSVFGTEETVQDVPHHRIFGNYMLERAPGANTSSFMGENENEIVAMMDGIISTYR
jgi:SPP1 gp7 family putative phage head morphogenesis protein